VAGINWLISMLRRATSGGDGSSDDMTADRALSYAPVWYAVSKITGAFMIMPLNLHRAVGREKSIQTRHPSYRLMRWRPNGYQTPAAFKRQMMCHALLWGNARAYIHRDGMLSELIPLMPDRTETMLVDGEKVHFVKVDRDDRLSLWEDIKREMERAKKEGVAPDVVPLADSEVLHIPGLGFDGVNGKSLITLARQSWGVGLGAETQERKKQRKGYAGGMMLEAPENVLQKEEQAKEFLKFFREQHDGEDNAGKTGLLTRGVKAHVLSMSNQDAQFIEQRRFQREDAALWFVLDAILGDSSNASYASSSEKNLAYRVNCLAPWTTAWEEEAELKLLTESERNRGYYFKFNDGALLRTEKAATMSFISQGIASRVLNPNEARELLDMNPYEEGDEFFNPAVTPGGASNQPKNPAKAENRAMLARLQHLLKVEAKQMVKACSASNFVDKVDALYAKWLKTWTATLGEELAAKHCEAAKAAILGCADKAKTAEELTAAVSECVAKWPDRAKELLGEMELVTC
jgi:HK97 family phage portal protein